MFLRTWPGFGGWPTWSGGNDYPETPPVVDREGGDNLLGLFLGDPFVDYLAAEQTGKRGAAYSLYIYMCVCVFIPGTGNWFQPVFDTTWTWVTE